MNPAGIFMAGIFSIGTVAALVSSIYVIDEGRIGVITNMGQAVRQEGPAGMQFKAPFISGVREFDVRERALPLQLSGATSNQLATTMDVTINWRPDPAQILDIFVAYGGPEEFAANVIRPRLAQSAKATIGQFSGLQLTQERNAVAEAIFQNAVETLSDYPALISSAQVDNFTLPERYWEAVLQREEQRETTQREQLLLEQQALQAQRDVQSAEAARDAEIARADGAAYATRTAAAAEADATRLRGDAEADALLARFNARADGQRAIVQALGSGELAMEYARNIAWNGVLPQTVLGNDPMLLMEITP